MGTAERRGVALIDLATNSVLPWRTTFWGTGAAETEIHTVDAEVSPDGSFIVVAGNGGDYPYVGRDAAVAFSITNVADRNAQPMWIARNFDSTYAVGISDTAVFIGGHFCWVESDLAPDPWPGDGEFTNNSCFGTTPAGRFAPAVVNRDQISALDPETGHALPWDPGSDGLEGVQSIEVIGRGVLVGHDGTFLGRDSDDVIRAGPGADQIDGLGGHDVVCGGPGSDWLQGGAGNDTAYGGDGMDTVEGGSGADAVFGQYGRDKVSGGPGADAVDGGVGRDRCGGGVLGGQNNRGDTKRRCERT